MGCKCSVAVLHRSPCLSGRGSSESGTISIPVYNDSTISLGDACGRGSAIFARDPGIDEHTKTVSNVRHSKGCVNCIHQRALANISFGNTWICLVKRQLNEALTQNLPIKILLHSEIAKSNYCFMELVFVDDNMRVFCLYYVNKT